MKGQACGRAGAAHHQATRARRDPRAAGERPPPPQVARAGHRQHPPGFTQLARHQRRIGQRRPPAGPDRALSIRSTRRSVSSTSNLHRRTARGGTPAARLPASPDPSSTGAVSRKVPVGSASRSATARAGLLHRLQRGRHLTPGRPARPRSGAAPGSCVRTAAPPAILELRHLQAHRRTRQPQRLGGGAKAAQLDHLENTATALRSLGIIVQPIWTVDPESRIVQAALPALLTTIGAVT